MTDTLLEQCRKLHAEIEWLQELSGKEFTRDPRGARDQQRMDERVAGRLGKVVESTQKLKKFYTEGTDFYDTRLEELTEISGTKTFQVYFQKVKELKENQKAAQVFQFAAKPDEVDVVVSKQWSGPEWQGRFLDLHSFHIEYQNLFKQNELNYKKYLQTFHHFHRIPNKHAQYQLYLDKLLNYLVDFWNRTHPIFQATKVIKALDAEFREQWDAAEVDGFRRNFNQEKLKELESKPIGSAGALGPQPLSDLPNVELYDIVTLKWFKNIGSLEGHRKGKKYLKRQEKIKNNPDFHFALAFKEAQVSLFAGLLEDTVVRTVEFVEKRQTKSYDEVRMEIEENENENDSDDGSDEEEDPSTIYNPLQIPVDFDGKPIPYWLYKFRGLNRYFDCEICGGRKYRGPMSYERHFSEWRHAHAMRTLGIPNTKDFMWITKVQDALLLWSKIKDRKKDAVWNPADEEVEDAQGNVFNRPTYENLHFQHSLI